MSVYYGGSEVKFTATFKNDDGDETDPSTIVFKIKSPNEDTDSYTYGTDSEVVRVSTGVYSYQQVVSTVGEWFYRWSGDGAVNAAIEGSIHVRPTEF